MLRRLTEQERAKLKAEFLKAAGEQWEEMFDPERQEGLRTFTQREDQACRAGDAMTRVLLGSHVRGDEAARPLETYACPDCGQPTRPLEEGDGPLPERAVVTRRGALRLGRPERACPACRRAIFPPRP